jgi:hypothetical protein
MWPVIAGQFETVSIMVSRSRLAHREAGADVGPERRVGHEGLPQHRGHLAAAVQRTPLVGELVTGDTEQPEPDALTVGDGIKATPSDQEGVCE